MAATNKCLAQSNKSCAEGQQDRILVIGCVVGGIHLSGDGRGRGPAGAGATNRRRRPDAGYRRRDASGRAGITQAPEPGRLNGVLPVAPRGQIGMLSDYIDPGQNFVTCPNQDLVYGLGFFSLDDEPVVIQVPDFRDRFWVYAMYDARTDQFAEVGKPYDT
jgi:Protein of unknown function (DUF1254)